MHGVFSMCLWIKFLLRVKWKCESMHSVMFHANVARAFDQFNPIHRVPRTFFSLSPSSHVGDFDSSFLRRKCVGWADNEDQNNFVQLVTSTSKHARERYYHVFLIALSDCLKNRTRYRYETNSHVEHNSRIYFAILIDFSPVCMTYL